MEQQLQKLKDDFNEFKAEATTRIVILEADVKTIKAKLDKIDSNTTWILRLIVGAFVLALVGLVITNK